MELKGRAPSPFNDWGPCQKNFKKLYGSFLWMGFNCLKATEPLRGVALLFTTKFPEIPGTHLIDLGRMKEFKGLGVTFCYLH